MPSSVQLRFQKAVANDSPVVALLKFKYFLAKYPKEAANEVPTMLQLAVKHSLIGDYENIFEILQAPPVRDPKYVEIREQMLAITNKLKVELQQLELVGDIEKIARCQLAIAEAYSSFGIHSEAISYFNRVFKTPKEKCSIRKQAYFSKWAQQLFYQNDLSPLTIFLTNPIEQGSKVDVNLTLLKDIKLFLIKSKTYFPNMGAGNITFNDFLGNNIISLADLGLLYSILVVTYSDREQIKKELFWSSKIEIAYHQHNFAKLLKDLDSSYHDFGEFNPLIVNLYKTSRPLIRERVLREFCSAYQSVTISKITEKTSIPEGEIKLFLKTRKDEPFLFDPITQSVVYYEKKTPLAEEATTLYRLLLNKFDDRMKGTYSEGDLMGALGALDAFSELF